MPSVKDNNQAPDEIAAEVAAGEAMATAVAGSLEVVVVPVSDVDRAKAFYEGLGWRLDADISEGDLRLVQVTPPGSSCSVQFGNNITTAPPGSSQDLYLVVPDIAAARAALLSKGIEVTEVFHCATGFACRFDRWSERRADGAAPSHQSYGSFASFADRDGNGWLLQEVTKRLPGRVVPGGAHFRSAHDLAEALRRARAAHGAAEAALSDENGGWPDWYADYIVSESEGT